jgi:hypothetical protein
LQIAKHLEDLRKNLEQILRAFEEVGKLEFVFGTFGSLWREVWWFECLLGLKFDLEVDVENSNFLPLQTLSLHHFKATSCAIRGEIIITKLKNFSLGAVYKRHTTSFVNSPFSNVFNTSFRKHLVCQVKNIKTSVE